MTQAIDTLPPLAELTAWHITQMLSLKYGNGTIDRYLFIPEMRVGTGYGNGAEQRVDAWMIALWPSDQLARHSFEIKISKSDYQKELANPVKRRAALRISNYYWFVAPKGMIDPASVPIECGLMEVNDKPRHYLNATVPAPWRDTPMPTWRFFAAFARNMARITNNQP